MKPEAFYAKVLAISNQPADRRVKGMNHLHVECMDQYLAAVRAINDKRASEVTPDGRTVGQIVAHIAEWEKYTALAIGEIVAGIKEPQIVRMQGFLESDGRVLSFKNVDDFNAYQARKHANTPWKEIQTMAIRMAIALQGTFSQPAILPYELLEQTAPYRYRLAGGSLISLPVAWYLWIVTLEHEIVDHAAVLTPDSVSS
jgi:hypothetical protein